MQTPARTKDSSKRASRLGSSTFSNPFKRRGSNAAVFTTPSSSDFSFQQLEDIGFADTQPNLSSQIVSHPPNFAWPPRKPLPRTSTTSTIPRPASRLPDSPTLRAPRIPLARTSSTSLPSRIPTPGVRNTKTTSPLKVQPAALATPRAKYKEINVGELHKQNAQENVKSSPVRDIAIEVPPPTHTTTNNAQNNRLSSYAVVCHQLLKPKSPPLDPVLPNMLALASHSSMSPSYLKTSRPNQTSPIRLPSSRCVSESPLKRLKLETLASNSQLLATKHRSLSPPAVLPPLTSSPGFDPTMTIQEAPAVIESQVCGQNSENAEEKETFNTFTCTDKSVKNEGRADVEDCLEPPSLASISSDGAADAEAKGAKHEINVDINMSVRYVFEAQSVAYWTGRFMSMNDRLMNEAHAFPDPRDADGEDKMHQLEIARTKQIFFTLEECCQTPFAEASLKQFKRMFALKKHMPFLLGDKPRTGIAGLLRRSQREEEKSNDWASLSSASTLSVSAEDEFADSSMLARIASNDSAVASNESRKSRFVGKLRRMAS